MNKIFALTLLVIGLTFTLPVYAQQVDISQGAVNGGTTGTATGSNLCGGDQLSALFCSPDIPSMLNSLFQIAISVGSILAMLRIGYAGYLYMGSADMWSSKTRAKEVFRDAIIGLLLLLAIWLILYQINPCILDLSVLNTGHASSQCGGLGTSGAANAGIGSR